MVGQRCPARHDALELIAVADEVLSLMGHDLTGLRAVGVSLQPASQTAPICGWESAALARAHPDLEGVPIIIIDRATFGRSDADGGAADEPQRP
jgi:hypothetical protein